MNRKLFTRFSRDQYITTYFMRQAEGLGTNGEYLEYGMLTNSYDDSFQFAVLADGNIIKTAELSSPEYNELWAYFSNSLAN